MRPGERYNDENIGNLYRDMLACFREVLVPGGRAVVLTARKDLLRGLAGAVNGLEIEDELPVLISGKKAGVFVLKRK